MKLIVLFCNIVIVSCSSTSESQQVSPPPSEMENQSGKKNHGAESRFSEEVTHLIAQGNTARKTGDLATAQDSFLAILVKLEKVAKDNPDSVQAQLDVHDVFSSLGDFALLSSDKKARNEFYGRGLLKLEELAAKDSSPEAQLGVGEGFVRQGDAAQEISDWESAKTHYQRSQSIAMQLLESDSKSPKAKVLLGNSYDGLGAIASEVGTNKEVREYYLKSIDAIKQIVDSDYTNRITRQTLIRLSVLSNLAQETGDLAEASKHYEMSLRTLATFAESGHSFPRRALRSIAWQLGETALKNFDIEGAHIFLNNCLTHALELVKSDPNSIFEQQELASCYLALGDLAIYKGAIPRAKLYYDESIKIRAQIAQKLPGSEAARRAVNVARKKRSEVDNNALAPPPTRKYYGKDIEITPFPEEE